MSARSAARRGRAAAQRLMIDTWEVTYATGETEQDPITGDELPVTAVRFTSRGRLKARSAGSEQIAGGADIVTSDLELHLPWDCAQPHADDIATCTATAAGSDARMLGMSVRIIGPVNQTFATATRLFVEEA